ncbi:MAG: hypothetical protein A3K18_22335 [Lentisphaerae bacterium RIFOXYA12_64_32]|nr:MAG: hypothetical protein A3K18_22335 [Lentisphaerae bacterium RIFOXYA12_64_32]
MTRAWVFSLLLGAVGTAQAADTYYVAPNGNDAWSGTLAAANEQKTDGPFATVVRARDAVRTAKKEEQAGPFAVELREGIYTLAEPLAFTPEDSGTAAAPVVYRAFAGEKPVLSGGRVIGGFAPATLNGVNCWRADVPEVKDNWYFRQLFVRRQGQAHFERRYRPVKGMLVIAGLTYSPERKTAPHRAAQQDFVFFKGDLQAWENVTDIEVVALHSWSVSRLCVESLDLEHNIAKFTSVPTFRIGHWYKDGRNPYYVENIKEELRSPGQWYLDRPSASLYYVPFPDETPETVTVVAPKLEKLMTVTGDAEKGEFVEHLRFERLAFSHVEWALPREGYDVSQGQPMLPAAVEFIGARQCAMERCTVAHVGAYGVGLGLGCHLNRIAGCFMYDLGGGGVKVGDCKMDKLAAYPVLPTDNVVENNVIAGGGLVNFSANGVWAGIVRGLAVRHNEVRDFPYSGVAVGWSWGYTPTSCALNSIEYNHIHHVMKLIQDGGGIYTLGEQRGTVIRGNVIHDSLKGPFACDIGQLGIYLDEGSGPYVIENNVVYDVEMGAFNQHYGRNNMVVNNIFAFARQEPITCARKEPHVSFWFTRNIVYQSTGNVISTQWSPSRCNTFFDGNLYYDTSGKEPMFGDRSFKDWQATGRDAGAVVADPRFVDPQKFDFALKPESPALKLGFLPIDMSQAGLEAAYRDVDDPGVRIVPPPVYAMTMPVLPPMEPGFSIDCEEVPVGMCPREFTRAGCVEGKSAVAVTEEVAKSGKRSLKFHETEGLEKPFYPYLTHGMRGQKIDTGKVTFGFDVRNSAETPALISVEMRDYENRGTAEFLTGPLLTFAEDGTVTAGTTPLGKLDLGAWHRVEVVLILGLTAPKTYTVTLTPSGGPARTATVPYVSDGFATVTWLGVVSAGTKTATFYLDDVHLDVARK